MTEAVVFKRRNRIKRDVVITSKVLLYGYENVADAAKITYQVIDGFDWEDKETKDSKGCAWPATDTVAKIRKTSVRTIERHITELEQAGLLTRVRRRNQPSILYIEDVSQAEIDKYLAEYVDQPQESRQKSNQGGGGYLAPKLSPKNKNSLLPRLRNDKNVVSGQPPETTKMSFAYRRKEKEEKENEINVNANLKIAEQKRSGKVSPIGELLKTYRLLQPKKTSKSDKDLERDFVAEKLAKDLDDQKSLGCYRLIVDKVPQHVIFQTLSGVKEAAEARQIRQSRGALFVEIIKNYSKNHGINLGFQAARKSYEILPSG